MYITHTAARRLLKRDVKMLLMYPDLDQEDVGKRLRFDLLAVTKYNRVQQHGEVAGYLTVQKVDTKVEFKSTQK